MISSDSICKYLPHMGNLILWSCMRSFVVSVCITWVMALW